MALIFPGPTFAAAQATTSGTAFDFTSIPSGVSMIHVVLDGVSLSGSDRVLIQLGDSGGVETTGYAAVTGLINNGGTVGGGSSTAGFPAGGTLAANTVSGSFTISRVNGNIWVCSGGVAFTNGTTNTEYTYGTKTLSAELDRVRLTRSGSDTFDAGVVNIAYWR